MASLESYGTEDYVVNDKREMADQDGEQMFQGTHNAYLEAKAATQKSPAERFVDMFFWVAVLASVAVVVIVVVSIVLQVKAARLMPITSSAHSFKMNDGTVLNAVITRPLNTKKLRAVVLELSTKRLSDASAVEFQRVASDLAFRGLIVVQVEARGVGGSSGPAITYPFSTTDIDDGVQLVELCAAVQGSNGHVGLMGLGVDATLAFLIAQRAPKRLGALVALHPADDWFSGDAFKDGNFQLALYQSLTEQLGTIPSAPNYALDENYIATRYDIQKREPLAHTLLQHQTYDSFWSNFTISPAAIKVPVYLIGGLYNPHKDSTLKLYAELRKNKNVPKIKAVLGPYDFRWPDDHPQGKNFSARTDVANWFKEWLAEEQHGFMREPDVVMYYQSFALPPNSVTGAWKFEGWPIERTAKRSYQRLGDLVRSAGLDSSESFILGASWAPKLGNIAQIEAHSLSLDLEVVKETFWLNGHVSFTLNVSTSMPNSSYLNWNVRLDEEISARHIARVTGCTVKEVLPEAGFHLISGTMHFTTWKFEKGRKLRLSITTSAPGMQWASQNAGTQRVGVDFRTSTVSIPVVNPRTGILGRTPTFTTITSPPKATLLTSFPYDRTFSVGAILRAVGQVTTWVSSQGYYSNNRDTLMIGFVGQNITTNGGTLSPVQMTRLSSADHIIITGVRSNMPDDPPNSGGVYLYDLMAQLEAQYSFGLDRQAASSFFVENAQRIPNLALDLHKWTHITTSTHMASDDTSFTVTSTRDAKGSGKALPRASVTKTFPRVAH